jgi:uncharacterized protein (DUF169 family)
MHKIYTEQLELLQTVLEIQDIVSIRFCNKKANKYVQYKDTACTALARSLKKKKCLFLDREKGQSCSGGNYFLGIKNCSKKEVCDVYVKDECVFKNNNVCTCFLDKLPTYPDQAKKKYILLTPLEKEEQRPDVIILLANPAQVGRLLGLSVFDTMQCPEIIPAGSTCLALFAPLVSQKIHLNFIDYYDRYYQGNQQGNFIWKETEMLVSLSYDQFVGIIHSIQRSPHGAKRINLKSQEISPFI